MDAPSERDRHGAGPDAPYAVRSSVMNTPRRAMMGTSSGRHAVAVDDGIADCLEQRLERIQDLLGLACRTKAITKRRPIGSSTS
jgi:hypothetical protein